MTSTGKARFALVTVSSDGFATGTAAMIASFRRTNPWFTGDIVIVADSLHEGARRLLTSDRAVRIVAAEPFWREAIDHLCVERPQLAKKRDRFLSLSALTLGGYDKLLFLDSDTLVAGDFGELFARPEPLLACADSATLRGERRDAGRFVRIDADSKDGIASFNAGMMLVDCTLLTDAIRNALLAGLAPGEWDRVETGHTDQLILNRVLAPSVTLVPSCFNLLLGQYRRGIAPPAIRASEVRLFHFNGPAKPWDASRMAPAAAERSLILYAWRAWHRALEDHLAMFHLAQAKQ